VEGAQNADAVMFVVSAYVQRNSLAKSRLPSVSFETLIVKAVQGEPITSPKKAPPTRTAVRYFFDACGCTADKRLGLCHNPVV
jgi:predicted transcriptional regulator